MIRHTHVPVLSAIITTCALYAAEPPVDQVALAKALIIPRLEFRDAWPSEVFDFIRLRTQDLDLAKKGVNIVTKELPASARPSKEAGAIVSPKARITFSATDISVFDAIARAAKLSGLEVTASKDGLSVHPARKK